MIIHGNLESSEFANAVIPVNLEAASAMIAYSSTISIGTLENEFVLRALYI